MNFHFLWVPVLFLAAGILPGCGDGDGDADPATGTDTAARSQEPTITAPAAPAAGGPSGDAGIHNAPAPSQDGVDLGIGLRVPRPTIPASPVRALRLSHEAITIQGVSGLFAFTRKEFQAGDHSLFSYGGAGTVLVAPGTTREAIGYVEPVFCLRNEPLSADATYHYSNLYHPDDGMARPTAYVIDENGAPYVARVGNIYSGYYRTVDPCINAGHDSRTQAIKSWLDRPIKPYRWLWFLHFFAGETNTVQTLIIKAPDVFHEEMPEKFTHLWGVNPDHVTVRSEVATDIEQFSCVALDPVSKSFAFLSAYPGKVIIFDGMREAAPAIYDAAMLGGRPLDIVMNAEGLLVLVQAESKFKVWFLRASHDYDLQSALVAEVENRAAWSEETGRLTISFTGSDSAEIRFVSYGTVDGRFVDTSLTVDAGGISIELLREGNSP